MPDTAKYFIHIISIFSNLFISMSIIVDKKTKTQEVIIQRFHGY